MKSSRLVLIGLLSASLAACSNFAQSFQPPNSIANAAGKTAASMDSWHFALTQSDLPGAGCFQATYPSTQWARIDCSAPPPHHFYPVPRSKQQALGQTVGGGRDFTADTSPHLMSKAIGAFPNVQGVRSVRSVGCCGVQGLNSYTLQLNSQFFPTPACGSITYCGGWEQFVFENPSHKRKGFLFIESWLVPMPIQRGHLSGCPPSGNWIYVGIGCYQNSQAVRIPNISVKDLGQLIETGRASPNGDSIYLSFGTTEYGMRNIQSDGVVDLVDNWTGAEFNIVGDAGGDVANFNAGSTITVSIQTDTGLTKKPACPANTGTTGETNNLFFVEAPKNPPQLRYPSVEFTMSSSSTGAVSCDTVRGR